MLNKSNYILTSFYYFKDALPYQPQIHLVDSGAFTFFSSGKKFDVDKYVGEFIYQQHLLQLNIHKILKLFCLSLQELLLQV